MVDPDPGIVDDGPAADLGTRPDAHRGAAADADVPSAPGDAAHIGVDALRLDHAADSLPATETLPGRHADAPAPPGVGAVAAGLDALNPVQRRTLDVLRRTGDPVVFDTDLIATLREEMQAAVDHFASRLDDRATRDGLWISKHKIASALDCEAHHLVPDEFQWTPANAKGTIAHRAIQLMLTWRGDPTPSDLVDEAMARLAHEERGIGHWIDTLSPGDDADVRGQTIERVTQFAESFPPLSKKWHPMTESAVRWPSSGPIVLSGKVDLVFGKPVGSESRKVIIDLKTGRPRAQHRQDLGFYALLETLAREVPPRKVATFYLDASEAHAEDVNERLLRSAVRRTLDGINAVVELESEGRPPVKRPGSSCRWCPLAISCDEGQAFLHDDDRPA